MEIFGKIWCNILLLKEGTGGQSFSSPRIFSDAATRTYLYPLNILLPNVYVALSTMAVTTSYRPLKREAITGIE